MPYNLTATNAAIAYTSSGAFGQALNAHAGTGPNPFPTNGTFTIEGRIKTPSSSGIQVAFGANKTCWVGISGGKATARYGFDGGEVELLTNVSINDGASHHLRLVLDGGNGGLFFVDGVLVASNEKSAAAAGAVYTEIFGIHTFAGLGYDWTGEIDEVAIFSTALSSANFTPPSAPYENDTAGLVALWHLDGNLNDSAIAAQEPTPAPTEAPTQPPAQVNNALSNGTANVLFSPYNWNVQASSAKTINPGAYFKTIFTGTSCTLNFDMTGIANPLPQISYRVDGFGPWITVPIAASVPITIPAATADYADKGGHLLEVLVKSMTETQPRWVTQSTAVALTGIVLATGKTLAAPPALPLNAIFYGDSITEGVRTVNMTAANDTDRNDAGQSWSLEAARILGAEIGNVGFGATGFTRGGSGSVPDLPTSYNKIYGGVARSFSPSPDFVVLMEGTNDGGDVTANATTVLNGLISATTAKIIVLQPFNGGHGSELQAAIAACSNPARCTYVSTSGWFNTSLASDGLHPYGNTNITRLAPLAANAIRAVITEAATPPTLTSRTVTVELATALGANGQPVPAANLTGLRVAFYDEPTPDLHTVPRFQSANETTDASGVMTFTVQSTLASGGSGSVVVQMADGRNLVRTVTVV